MKLKIKMEFWNFGGLSLTSRILIMRIVFWMKEPSVTVTPKEYLCWASASSLWVFVMLPLLLSIANGKGLSFMFSKLKITRALSPVSRSFVVSCIIREPTGKSSGTATLREPMNVGWLSFKSLMVMRIVAVADCFGTP